jgi:hypothetical protein
MSELSIGEQIALMNPTQLSFYRKHRRKAVLFGFIQLLTFPLFSLPVLIPISLALAGEDPWAQKGAIMITVVLSPFVLVPIAIGFGALSKKYRSMARNIRWAVLNAHAPMTDESNTLNP